MDSSLTEAKSLLEWNEVLPYISVVTEQPDEDHAAEFFVIRADYGWAERILCTCNYHQDALAIEAALKGVIDAN